MSLFIRYTWLPSHSQQCQFVPLFSSFTTAHHRKSLVYELQDTPLLLWCFWQYTNTLGLQKSKRKRVTDNTTRASLAHQKFVYRVYVCVSYNGNTKFADYSWKRPTADKFSRGGPSSTDQDRPPRPMRVVWCRSVGLTLPSLKLDLTSWTGPELSWYSVSCRRFSLVLNIEHTEMNSSQNLD